MGFDGVAWGVGGGAMHGPELYRLAAYISGNQNVGVIGPDDLKVSQLDVPGAGVKVIAGGVIIPCRTAGYTYQSYLGRCPTPALPGVTAQPAGSARRDLIVAQVRDPWLPTEPWADPVSAADGPYVDAYVLEGVSGIVGTGANLPALRLSAEAYCAANNLSAVPLAVLDMPASTGTVTNAMLLDVRRVANPRRDRSPLQIVQIGSVINCPAVTTPYTDWFTAGTVEVPLWATKVSLALRVEGARIDKFSGAVAGTALGAIRMRMGGTGPAPLLATQPANYDLEATVNDNIRRLSVGAGDTVAVPVALRGTMQSVIVQGIRTSGNKTLLVDTGSTSILDVEFSGAI